MWLIPFWNQETCHVTDPGLEIIEWNYCQKIRCRGFGPGIGNTGDGTWMTDTGTQAKSNNGQ